MFIRSLQIELWLIQHPDLGTDFLPVSPGPSRASVSGEKLLLEQQLFLPHDQSTVAMSWALYGNLTTAARLVVRPFFSGCGPRFYRDLGFRLDSNGNAGRLTWLPNVLGPKLFADTNG